MPKPEIPADVIAAAHESLRGSAQNAAAIEDGFYVEGYTADLLDAVADLIWDAALLAAAKAINEYAGYPFETDTEYGAARRRSIELPTAQESDAYCKGVQVGITEIFKLSTTDG